MIEQIAKTAHAIHRAYCLEMGIPTQPKWEDVENGHKDVVYNSIRQIMQGSIKSVEESHNKFIESKYTQGWRFGEVYSIEDKLNPRMVDFIKLTAEQRVKERLFFECVSSFN
jgi:hypothetical protein|tara:strand:+ start:604 stop:939 length:336 start_codon:yes stop_codon:yes gene_type:complete